MDKTAISDDRHVFAPVEYVRIGTEHAGRRIDHFLASHMRGVPHGRVQRVLRRGEARVNRGRVGPGYCLKTGDVVRLPPYSRSKESTAVPAPATWLRRLEESVIFEDERLLVINKPAGISVHGGVRKKWHVLTAWRQLRPELPFLELAHRLDKDTSGCLLLCKSPSLLRQLHNAFRDGQVCKRYLAVVAGRAPQRETIDRPLIRGGSSGRSHTGEPGRQARTQWRLLRHFRRASLVEMRPLTGRTHQLRVHAADIGHPVAGDRKYGQAECNRYFASLGLKRLFLHAAGLRVALPVPVPPSYAPLPGDLRRVLARLQAAEAVPREDRDE